MTSELSFYFSVYMMMIALLQSAKKVHLYPCLQFCCLNFKWHRDLVEDTTIIEKFLKEEGLDESKREKILSIIKNMGDFFPSL